MYNLIHVQHDLGILFYRQKGVENTQDLSASKVLVKVL